jgi:hypothetical protein
LLLVLVLLVLVLVLVLVLLLVVVVVLLLLLVHVFCLSPDSLRHACSCFSTTSYVPRNPQSCSHVNHSVFELPLALGQELAR